MPRLQLKLASRPEDVPLAGTAVSAIGRLVGLSDAAAQDLELAVCEAINNVIEHAYRGSPDRPVELHLSADAAMVVVEVRDQGIAATPERLLVPDLDSLDVDPSDILAIAESGRGIPLMHLLLDELSYETADGWNRLTLIKRLTPHAD